MRSICPLQPGADPASGAEVASLRNATVHEALLMGEPLGFAIHGTGANQNLTLEMQALLCRVVVALLGQKVTTTCALRSIRASDTD